MRESTDKSESKPTPGARRDGPRDAPAAGTGTKIPSRPGLPIPIPEELARRPYRFTFFQAVRLLRLIAERTQDQDSARHPVGEDIAPGDEIVRFRAIASFTFPPGEISGFTPAQDQNNGGPPAGPPEMIVPWIGLFGPSGVLPQHYTQMVIDRVREKDHSLRDFLDIFHHRTISHFYRAWEKYRLPVMYESAMRSTGRREHDLCTQGLFSLMGLGTGGLRNRQEIDDQGLLYYVGQFSQSPRNAVSLERMIAEFFQVTAEVLQFQGQWLALDVGDQTSLSPSARGRSANNQLGVTAVAGHRVWGVQSKFRIKIGPLAYDDFVRYSPLGDRLTPVSQFVRTYAGPDLDFDVQVVLRREDVPACRLGGDPDDASRLGWNTWIHSQEMEADAEDAVFQPADAPSQ
jgi:type VI secretion system protein ImpH